MTLTRIQSITLKRLAIGELSLRRAAAILQMAKEEALIALVEEHMSDLGIQPDEMVRLRGLIDTPELTL